MEYRPKGRGEFTRDCPALRTKGAGVTPRPALRGAGVTGKTHSNPQVYRIIPGNGTDNVPSTTFA